MPLRDLEPLKVLNRFLTLQIDREKELQEIVELAAVLCESSTSIITLSDVDKYQFTFKHGTDMSFIERKDSFCYHIIDDEILVIPDALEDERFANNPFVIGGPRVRFYAGVSLKTHDGMNLGSLCVLNEHPKDLTDGQRLLFKSLGKRVIQILEFNFSINILKEQYVQAKNAEIKLRSFFESVGACHLLLGKNLEVIAYNKIMARFIKEVYNIELYEGIHVSEILTGASLERFIKEYNESMSGKIITYEREVKYDVKTIWWDVTFNPGYNKEGEIIGIHYNATDITERKIHVKYILEQNESLKKIAYIQSHEVRKPLASILGLVEIIQFDSNSLQKENIEMLARAAHELDEVIRTVVKISDDNGNFNT